jgi:hypothetical protein
MSFIFLLAALHAWPPESLPPASNPCHFDNHPCPQQHSSFDIQFRLISSTIPCRFYEPAHSFSSPVGIDRNICTGYPALSWHDHKWMNRLLQRESKQYEINPLADGNHYPSILGLILSCRNRASGTWLRPVGCRRPRSGSMSFLCLTITPTAC